MSDNDTSRSSRRRFLAVAGTAGVAALAGCGGSGGDATTTSGGDATPTAGDSSTTAGDSTTTTAGTLPTPTLGEADAPVTVQVFEDYACPHCRQYSLEIFPRVKSEYVDTGLVRYQFHDFPIPVAQSSRRAASAARAVQDTVDEAAFWTYSKSLFENQQSLSPSTYADLAEPVGADPDTVREAAVTQRYEATVSADRQLGVDMGVPGTPGIFVDGGEALESYGFEALRDAIEAARSTA